MRPGDTFTLKLYATAQGKTDKGAAALAGAFLAYDTPGGFAESLSPDGETMMVTVQVLGRVSRWTRTGEKRPSPEDWLESAELQQYGWALKKEGD